MTIIKKDLQTIDNSKWESVDNDTIDNSGKEKIISLIEFANLDIQQR